MEVNEDVLLEFWYKEYLNQLMCQTRFTFQPEMLYLIQYYTGIYI